MTTPYSTWKAQQDSSIYKDDWRPHAPVILMMFLDRIKEKHILRYLKDELKLKNPKKSLRDCREWSGAPDPNQLKLSRKKRKAKIFEMLTKIWQDECNVPNTEAALAAWTPKSEFGFSYDSICQKEAELDESQSPSFDLEESSLEASLDLSESSSDEETLDEIPGNSAPLFSTPQQRALKELNDIYVVSKRAQDLDVSIIPRTNCLMVGPSGSGKTFLARTFAEDKGVPFMSINVSTWMLTGSRSESENCTLVQIAEFIVKNPDGIIYLDELDKINGPSSWIKHLQLEIHNLLDCQIGVSVLDGLSKRLDMQLDDKALTLLNQSLKDDFFIIAGGTWQEFWENRNVSCVGFNSTKETRKLDKKELTKHVSSELLQRFQQTCIVLNPLNRKDFLELADNVAQQLKAQYCDKTGAIHTAFLKAIQDGLDLAVENKIGMRFLEECITEALKPKDLDHEATSAQAN